MVTFLPDLFYFLSDHWRNFFISVQLIKLGRQLRCLPGQRLRTCGVLARLFFPLLGPLEVQVMDDQLLTKFQKWQHLAYKVILAAVDNKNNSWIGFMKIIHYELFDLCIDALILILVFIMHGKRWNCLFVISKEFLGKLRHSLSLNLACFKVA